MRKVVLKLLGVEAAFLRELGCGCKRCNERKARANTSAVLLLYGEDESTIERVVLFDCGAGVLDGLIDLGITRIDAVFNTHDHFDHIAEADRLVNSQRRAKKPMPLPWYCSDLAWEYGVKARFPWLQGPSGLLHNSLKHGVPVELGFGVDLRITPLTVYHGKTAMGPMIFVVEFCPGSDGKRHKIVIGWDLLHLLPRYQLEDVQEGYAGSTAERLDPLHAQLFKGIDLLLLEVNTWTRKPGTGHSSTEAALACHVPLVFKPAHTVFVHYSGHEDADGALTDGEFQARLAHHPLSRQYRMELGYHGQTFHWDV